MGSTPARSNGRDIYAVNFNLSQGGQMATPDAMKLVDEQKQIDMIVDASDEVEVEVRSMKLYVSVNGVTILRIGTLDRAVMKVLALVDARFLKVR